MMIPQLGSISFIACWLDTAALAHHQHGEHACKEHMTSCMAAHAACRMHDEVARAHKADNIACLACQHSFLADQTTPRGITQSALALTLAASCSIMLQHDELHQGVQQKPAPLDTSAVLHCLLLYFTPCSQGQSPPWGHCWADVNSRPCLQPRSIAHCREALPAALQGASSPCGRSCPCWPSRSTRMSVALTRTCGSVASCW